MKNLSVRQFANREGISLQAVYARLWAGRIPGAVQVDGRWRIPVTDQPSQTSQSLPVDWKSRAAGDRD